MNFFEKVKKFFSNEISDEEVENNDWVQCPKCLVNIQKKDLIDNDYDCPNCFTNIDIVEK